MNPVHREAVERRQRRQRWAAAVHRLGPRPFLEFLLELDRVHGLGDDLDRRLARYAGIDPGMLRAIGGDRFPAAPLRLVSGGGQ